MDKTACLAVALWLLFALGCLFIALRYRKDR